VNRDILNNYIKGVTTGAKIFEIIAQASMCIDDLTSKECDKINKGFASNWFSVCTTNEGERYLFLRRSIENSPELSKELFIDLIKQENRKRKGSDLPQIEYDERKISFEWRGYQ
jgi:hypothetical protein